MITGQVSNLQDFSVNDGDGIRTTVFFSGCPLRCLWCSNPETLYSKGTTMTIEEVFSRIKRSLIFFQRSGGGVTFSGGEPTAQIEFLEALVDRCIQLGIHTAIESCGYFDFESVKGILEKLDLIFFDIKHMDEQKHEEATGRPNRLILENIKKAAALGKDIVIRIPLIHPYNDSEENIRSTAAFVKKYIPKPKIELLPYHFFGMEKYEQLGRAYPGKEFSTPSKESISTLKDLLQKEGIQMVSF